jgi:SAM-dependent methyltransferase
MCPCTHEVYEMSLLLMACPICSDDRLEIYVEGQDQILAASMVGSSRTEVSPGRVLRCRGCRFGFRQFRPSDGHLAQLYQELDTRVYDAESMGRSRTAEVHFRLIESYVTKPGRILDVGCASGLFLRCALDANWEVVGVEPSEVLARKAQEALGPQTEIHCSTLQAAGLPAGSFEVVTLWDLLEHVPDPVLFLRRCALLLKPQGYLFANVPDLDSVQSRLLRARWPLLLPEHLNYFAPRSLRICGEKAGLRWMGFCRRPVAFSVDYILYRLGQHRIPGTSFTQKLVKRMGLGNRLVWAYLGEICGVWRC